MIDPRKMMQAMSAWNKFKENHPKFPAFVQAVSRKGIVEGTIIDINIVTPEGEKVSTNIKVQDSDLALFESLK